MLFAEDIRRSVTRQNAAMHIPSELTRLTDGVHAWLPDGGGTWGLANCVLISSGSEALLVDTPYTARLTESLIAAAERVLPAGAAVTTVVNTHANGDHTFGNGHFPQADIITSRTNLDHLCHEPNPQQTHYLVRETDPDEPMGWYARRHFGRYDYTGLDVTAPTRTFSGRCTVGVGATEVELIEVGPAHTPGDVIVHVPERDVVIAGDVLFIGDHPVHWAGPLGGVARACETVLALDPEVVVPGHGPVVTPDRVRAYVAYLHELEGLVRERHARGLTAYEAASEILAGGFHDHLGLRERIVILTAIEYGYLDGSAEGAPETIRLLGDAARWAHEQSRAAVAMPASGSAVPQR